jgi:hypothetical protein
LLLPLLLLLLLLLLLVRAIASHKYTRTRPALL